MTLQTIGDIYTLLRGSTDQEDAWRVIVNEFRDDVLSFAKRIGVDESDAEDLAQDVFIALIRAVSNKKAKADRPILGWLAKACKYARSSLLKRRQLGIRGLGDYDDNLVIDPDEFTAKILREHDVHLVMQKYIDCEQLLNESIRPIWCRWKCGTISIRNIAAELGIDRNAVARRITKAQKIIRACLQRQNMTAEVMRRAVECL